MFNFYILKNIIEIILMSRHHLKIKKKRERRNGILRHGIPEISGSQYLGSRMKLK